MSVRHTADGRLSRLQPRDGPVGGRWSSVVSNVPAEKKKIIIITKTQKTGGGADECASGACARGARESELQEDRVQAATATMGRVHPARISFCTLCRGGVLQETDRCRLHRRTI
ncbi:hypothetical protein FWK35_00015612 [Aphis craccivora]|uniref:Uncharacterized protein n=1 Tax=Aphis craccivora TaxID=307492 RepID=A0A6G0Z2L1_APHCR|nr:hypothetical protein FWK35_00015612 [Aphis craccivora]